MLKIGFSLIGFALMTPMRVQYLRRLVRAQISTHAMTWAIWGVLGGIAFVAQFNGGGAALLNTGSATTFCFTVAVISLLRGQRDVTRSDWITLTACCLAGLLWVIFDTPLWSVCAATLIDVLGYLPVARKAWRHPHSEGLLIFVTAACTWSLATAAISNYTMLTTLYTASVAATNGLFAGMILFRRRALRAEPGAMYGAPTAVPSRRVLAPLGEGIGPSIQ
jgi:hypothetical protein